MAWYSGISNYFNSGSGWSDLLSGVAAVAGSSSDKKKDKTDYDQALGLVKETSTQGMRKSAFEKQLEDYYKQKDTYNKRVAIDSYGQFSKLQARAPGYTSKPVTAPGAAPDYTKF